MRLVLASASPRRAELLTAAGFSFEVCVTDVDERVLDGELPHAYVRRLATEKARWVFRGLAQNRKLQPDRGGSSADAVRTDRSGTNQDGGDVLILGADTAVIVDAEILGKPVDEVEAERMLRRLSGRTHVVMTGLSVVWGRNQVDAVEETLVFVDTLSDQQIEWYLASGEGQDKAGGYAIQGLASRFIPRIEGSYSNVVGLPIARVAELISRFG